MVVTQLLPRPVDRKSNALLVAPLPVGPIAVNIRRRECCSCACITQIQSLRQNVKLFTSQQDNKESTASITLITHQLVHVRPQAARRKDQKAIDKTSRPYTLYITPCSYPQAVPIIRCRNKRYRPDGGKTICLADGHFGD